MKKIIIDNRTDMDWMNALANIDYFMRVNGRNGLEGCMTFQGKYAVWTVENKSSVRFIIDYTNYREVEK